MAYHHFVDGLHTRLAELGWHDVRPSYGFVLLFARDAPTTPTEIAALLGVTKQAASVLVASMQRAGYLEQVDGPRDGRVKSVALSARARELLGVVESIYADLESRWAEVVGTQAVEAMRRDLRTALEVTHGGALPDIRPTQ